MVAQGRRTGHAKASSQLAAKMYADTPYAREVGHVGEATAAQLPAGAATPAGVMEGHDVPPDVLNSVVYWMRKFCNTGQRSKILSEELNGCRNRALLGAKYCANEGCEVEGHLKDFKVCPQCKTARYCGDECQKQDWIAGGHRETCGTGYANWSKQ
jgi:hypothetical protein